MRRRGETLQSRESLKIEHIKSNQTKPPNHKKDSYHSFFRPSPDTEGAITPKTAEAHQSAQAPRQPTEIVIMMIVVSFFRCHCIRPYSLLCTKLQFQILDQNSDADHHTITISSTSLVKFIKIMDFL